MLFAALTTLVAAASVLASPVNLATRALNPSKVPAGATCASAPGGFDTASGFTLNVYNTTAGGNPAGDKLVFVVNTCISGACAYDLGLLSVTHADKFHDTTLNMSAGNITSPDSGTATITPPGNQLGFVFTTLKSWPTVPETTYCGVPSTSGTGQPLLALGGDTENFQMCGPPKGYSSVSPTLVYKPVSNFPQLYDFNTCYPVRVEMVGLTQ